MDLQAIDGQSGVWAALVLGFLLGLKHATDADHVVAVSTIVGESKSAWRGLWIGGSWGLGHTTPLLVLGVVILAFQNVVLDRYETVAPVFEFGVGVMLVLLGVQVFWNLRRGRLHTHQHAHDNDAHVHIHATHDPSASPDVETAHSFWKVGRPVFRLKSYAIGVVHGLAGSAAVMLVLLPSLSSFWVGVGYLLLFGLGTMLSMAAITLVLGVPFAITAGSRWVGRTISSVAGVASVAFGAALMSDISLGTAFVPF
jgi:ABC-type nickel/cobalt efflux system permease component RcnA